MSVLCEFRILRDEAQHVRIQIEQTEIRGAAIPILGDSFVAVVVLKRIVRAGDGEDALEDVLGCEFDISPFVPP
jgi:hypothetical protein